MDQFEEIENQFITSYEKALAEESRIFVKNLKF